MTRRISIINITPSTPTAPGSFVIGAEPDNPSGNWAEVFKGKFYRDAGGATQDYYIHGATPPTGYTLVKATTFQVVDNSRYAGTYSVFTKTSVIDSTTFTGSETTVRVNQVVRDPLNPTDLTSGYITNVSTYYVLVDGGGAVVVPPGVNLTSLPVELVGRDFAGWGESYAQNLMKLSQTFSGPTAPPSPLRGQQWYKSTTNQLFVWSGSAWTYPNRVQHTQTAAATTWTINHNLGMPAPYLVEVRCYVDTGGGVYKQVTPNDITYTTANQVTVTFATNQTGIAVVTP